MTPVPHSDIDWKLVMQAVPIIITLLALAVQTGFVLNRLTRMERDVEMTDRKAEEQNKDIQHLSTKMSHMEGVAERAADQSARLGKLEVDHGKLDVSQRALLGTLDQMQKTQLRLEEKIDRVLERSK